MASKTISKGTDSKKATLSPVGSVELKESDPTLTISINTTSFVGSENIHKIEFWDDVNGGKGTNLVGTWYRNSTDGASNQPDDVGIGDDPAGTGVIFTDNNTEVLKEEYYYKVFTSDGRAADPELVLKKRAQTG